MFPDNLLIVLSALVVIVNRFVGAFVTPAWDRLKLDKFWLQYVAWLCAGVLIYLTGINVFSSMFPAYPLVGQVLTAVFAGGGANILHDLTDKPKETALTSFTSTIGYIGDRDIEQRIGGVEA